MSPSSLRRRGAWAVLLMAAAGCDATPRGRDASAPRERVAEVAVRVDLPSAAAPSISVLAFRASVSGVGPADVLGVVDPLVAAPPATQCELRDVAGASKTLRAQGGAIELEELANVVVGLGNGASLRPLARVYPQLAAVVGGVIGEAGPTDVVTLPETITVALSAADADKVTLPLRAVPKLDGIAPGAAIDTTKDLHLTLIGPRGSFVELRPFGSTVAIACAGGDGRVVIGRDLLERLMAASGRVPVSFEAVWRDTQVVATAGVATRVSIEARASAVLELRP